ncbi:MAG: hypothetical protein WBA54_09255 [Acidaminobacteraceae bacterium]
MNKKLVLALMLLSIMVLLLGCQNKSVDPNNEPIVEIIDEVDKDTNVVSNSSVEVTTRKSSVQVMDEFDSIKTKSAFNMIRFIDENIRYVDTVAADILVTSFISKSNEEIESSNEYLYSEDSVKIADLINKTVVFDGNYSIFSDKRYQLIRDLDDEVIKNNLLKIFEKGQGLISSEGTYYAVVDYLYLFDKYRDNVSRSLSDYLEIVSIETTDPSTVEEYLAISLDELKVRVIRYEKFLMENGSAPYADEVKSLYMFSIWKIVNPSIFDSQLNNDFTVNKTMIKFYNETKGLAEYPVLQDAVNGFLMFLDSREGGVVGSLENSDEMISNANLLYKNAGNQIDKLYMSK